MKAGLKVVCAIGLVLINTAAWGLEGRPGTPEMDAVVRFDPQPRDFRVKAIRVPSILRALASEATFLVTYTNFTVEQQTAFQEALNILAPLSHRRFL